MLEVGSLHQCSFLSPVPPLPLGSVSCQSSLPPGTNIRAAQETTIRTTTVLIIVNYLAATVTGGSCRLYLETAAKSPPKLRTCAGIGWSTAAAMDS
ncbi:uncharacterized protein DS421_18g622780 [Arachis hypogaea]|nr:uncharacterized protein DS421_18g622780 [Arachis hypogaea]